MSFLPSRGLQGQSPDCVPPPDLGALVDATRVEELGTPWSPSRAGDALRRGTNDLAGVVCDRTRGDGHGHVRPLPVIVGLEYRSAYPGDVNDGPRWAGRGLSTDVTAGVGAAWGPFELVLAPTVAWQQNADVTIAGGGTPYRYPYNTIDWPQRFGDASFATVNAGQSALSATVGPVQARAASESLWWGPAHRYPILLSNTGPGVPHVALAPTRPVWVGIGHVNARLMWGMLDESDYFDARPENDRRLLTGAFVELRPWALPGLTLGGGLLYHLPWEDVGSRVFDLFTFAFSGRESSAGNALASLTGRWVHPESGFEAYVEWAREDFWLNTEDLLTEPDHSQGYTLGFAKLFDGETAWMIQGELTHLQSAPTWQTGRGPGRNTFFVHGTVEQGHTNRGQLLGSSVGPGADAQFLAVSRMGAPRTLGVFLERTRRGEDTYYDDFADTYGFRGHDLEWTAGVHGVEPAGRLSLAWSAGVSRRKNRSFIGLDGRNWDILRETNLSARVRVRWDPSGLGDRSGGDGDGGDR